MDENFAVFEALGEEWEQVTIFLPEDKANEYLNNWRKRNPQSIFYVLERKKT